MGVISAWLAEMIIITLRDVKKGATNNVAGFPLPADYLATFAIFGVLGALPDSAKTFSTVTAWGFVVATALNFFDPTLNKTTSSPAVSPGSAPTGPGTVVASSTPAANTAS